MTAIGYRLSAVGCRLSAIGCRLSAIVCRLSAIGWRLSAVRWLYSRKQGGACGAEGHMASIGPPALGAKGCVERLHPTGETTHYDLCVAGAPANHVRCASLRSGGRRLAVRKTIEYQIGILPRTPFPAAREFPSRGNERYEEKNRESYTSCTTPAFPLWWLAPPPFPRKRGHYGCLALGPCFYRKA